MNFYICEIYNNVKIFGNSLIVINAKYYKYNKIRFFILIIIIIYFIIITQVYMKDLKKLGKSLNN